jgi:hypothetical protein
MRPPHRDQQATQTFCLSVSLDATTGREGEKESRYRQALIVSAKKGAKK